MDLEAQRWQRGGRPGLRITRSCSVFFVNHRLMQVATRTICQSILRTLTLWTVIPNNLIVLSLKQSGLFCIGNMNDELDRNRTKLKYCTYTLTDRSRTCTESWWLLSASLYEFEKRGKCESKQGPAKDHGCRSRLYRLSCYCGQPTITTKPSFYKLLSSDRR